MLASAPSALANVVGLGKVWFLGLFFSPTLLNSARLTLRVGKAWFLGLFFRHLLPLGGCVVGTFARLCCILCIRILQQLRHGRPQLEHLQLGILL
jgi:hypothetical protein